MEFNNSQARVSRSRKALRKRPVLLDLNHETRYEALKVYHPSFQAELLMPAYFNPEIDTLVLGNMGAVKLFRDYNAKAKERHSMVVRHLALCTDPLPPHDDIKHPPR
jgi:hypothetical protein